MKNFAVILAFCVISIHHVHNNLLLAILGMQREENNDSQGLVKLNRSELKITILSVPVLPNALSLFMYVIKG